MVSFGAKDLQDLQGASRLPLVAIAQKQAQPDEPRPPDAGAAPVPEKTAAGQIFAALKQFAASDFVAWAAEYVRYRFGSKHPLLTYQRPEDGIYPLEGDGGKIRLGLASDWGTGTDEAYKVGQLIEAFDPHYTIHLGDVYFVGDAAEVGQNFLGQKAPGSKFTPCRWPRASKACFALNGNHEMLARGFGYFDGILPAMGEMKGGEAQGQKASFFCLLNADWCFLGLDTGYNSVGTPILEQIWQPDASLPDDVVTWLRAIASRIENRAIVIMTHHQVLSLFDECFTKQAEQVFSILQRPVLWFWGHEHRLVIYQAFDGHDRQWPTIMGRCIGHGGMPVDLPGTAKTGQLGAVEFLDKRPYHNDEGLTVGINGMVLLTIDGAELGVTYVDVQGASVFEERFLAQGGAPVRTAFNPMQLSQL